MSVNSLNTPLLNMYIVCSSIIEIVKRVDENRYNARFVEHFIVFTMSLKFNKTGAQRLDSILLMAKKV